MLDQYGKVVEGAELRIGFYLADQFSLLPFASAVEPLRIANRLSRKALYQWFVVTADGNAVHATAGMPIHADYSVRGAPEFDLVFVSGPHEPQSFADRATLNWLAGQGRRDIVIGGLETGTIILAEAGLLDDVESTTHWENLAEYRTAFPRHRISSDLFEVDGSRMTCAGGSASMDMMLYMIEQHHGHELAASVADVMIHPHIRHAGEPQRMDIRERTGVNHPVLLKCLELMEANIEEPLTPWELAQLVGVSKRHLERLFRRYLSSTPARYYLTLRLIAAKAMLERGTHKIIDVSIACGFKSAGHFSSRYYSSFGMTPRESRNSNEGRGGSRSAS